MFKKFLPFFLLMLSFLTGNSLQAHDCCNNNWAAFGAGVGFGMITTEMYNANRPGACCYPQPCCCGTTTGCVIYSEPPPVVIQQPVVQQVVYKSNYDFIGKSIVSDVASTTSARKLTLDNGMVFEIAPGTFNWTGYSVTIYRDAYAGTTGNYVLELRDQQYRANRLAGNAITTPIKEPIPAPRPN